MAERLSPTNVDLEAIPRDRWEQTLSALHRQERFLPIRRLRDAQLREQASEIAFELNVAEEEAVIARQEARGKALRQSVAPLPSPDAEHPATRQSVQVNLRLRPDDYAKLTDAARAVGLRPTTLARALVLNGAAQVLRERGGAT